MPKINSLEVVHQDTNKDSYQNLHDILVALNKSLALEKEIVDGDARVAIENLLEMYVNDKEAFLRSLQTLTAQFKESQAQFSQEILLKASELEALARRITTLSAATSNNNALIYHEQTVRSTADEALATDIATVSATAGSKNRTYYQSTAPSTTLVSGDLWIDSDDDQLYRWNGSAWVSVQDNAIGVNAAAITTEATARANGDSANATLINAVTARLDTGDFATVKTTSEATALKVTPRDNIAGALSTWTQNGTVNSVTQSVMPIIQSETPTGTFTTGTYWFDSNNNYKMYMYNGSSWVAVTSSVLVFANTPWGEAVIGNASSTYYIESPFFSVTAGSTYTVAADIMSYSSVGNVYCDVRFYNSSGTLIKDGTQSIVYGIKSFSDTDTNRNAIAVADTAPTSATQAKARFVVSGVSNLTVGVRQIKVELGGLPATSFTALNYASAKWGIKTNADGYVSGIELNSDSTGTSNFVVAANNFIVKKPDGTNGIAWNGTNSRLDISGDVYANNFYGNVVGTDNINNNAVTIPLTQTLNNTLTGNGALQQAATVSFTAPDSINILVIYNGQSGYPGSAIQELHIYVDGVEQAGRGGYAINDYPTIAWSGTVSSGSHTVTVYWYGSGSGIVHESRTLSVWGNMR